MALAFAAGVAVGVFCGRDCLNRVVPVDANVSFASDKDGQIPSDAFETNASTGMRRVACGRDSLNRVGRVDAFVSNASDKDGQTPETTVEVTYADAPDESSAEITAAHRERRAKRAAAREAKAERRRDIFSRLNLDLLSPDQRKLHAEYAEAVAVRDAARREIRDLRMKGEEVPADLSRRLADAESVICADAEQEHRALREAAARAHGLDNAGVEALLEDLSFIDSTLGSQMHPAGSH